MPNTQSEALKWEPCFVDPKRGIAFFDGITIESDPITDPRWDRVLPVLQEEQIFVCRQMYLRFEQALKDKQDVWVLDVGTGNGVFAIWAAKKWKCKVVAIDINPRALMIAEKNASKNDITVCHSRKELEEKIAQEKETGVIWLQYIKFDRDFVENYQHKFDLVFLSPSYTPIIEPKLIPPLYDTLGGDGQKSFKEQISLVPKILKEDGCCIGHQMTPVGSDNNMTAVTEIKETFKEPWKLRYTHILDQPEWYSSRKFLEEVYQFYLCPQESCNNLSRSRAIKGFINDFSKTNHYLAFLYYEVSREEEKELIIRRHRVPKKNWEHRIKMHRAVVENTDHSSKGNFFPLPSLFTRKSPIPELPEINLGNLSETELTPQNQWENSPIKAVDCWINQAQILEFLDLIVVDIVPYDYLGGIQKIYQESKIWLQESDKKLAKELLDEWLLTIQDRKKAGVTQRLHPGFVGTNDSDQWRDIQYTLLQQKIPSITSKFNLTEKEIEVLNSIVGDLQDVSQKREQLPKKKINFSEDKSYSIWTLEDQDEYPDNEKRQSRIDAMQIENRKKAILMDLRLCHLGIHQHLDKRYSELLAKYEKKDYEWSALIGLPLSPSFNPIKGKINAAIDNNSYYRGAFWIYARSSTQWALKQERKLFDLARFLWLMYESKYNAEAYASLYALKNFQASSVFGHEVKHISYAISHRWLAKPNNDLKELVGEFPEWGWGDQWRVIPLPELLETAGKVIRLWCQTNNPRDVFNPLPKTMAELVQQCWQLAKDSIKPRFSYKFDLSEPKELKQVKDLLDQVDQLWQDKFKIRVDEKVPKPDWSEEKSYSQQWMELARLFLTVFGNCVKYANTDKEITVNIVIEYENNKKILKIAIINYLKDEDSESKLHEQIKMARQRVQTAPLIRQYSGTKIMNLYVIRLGGRLIKHPKDLIQSTYQVEFRIPIESLSGRPT